MLNCVKCAGQHETKNCSRKTRDSSVRCVNCGGDHPANHRGCLVHKQLQQKLYPALIERGNIKPQTQPITRQQIQSGITFAQKVNKSNEQNINNHDNQKTTAINQIANNMTKLEEMLSKLMEQMGTMLNLLATVVNKLAQWQYKRIIK